MTRSVAEIEAELAALQAEKARQQAEPEPPAVYYGVPQHPDEAIAATLADGHEVSGQAGLGAGLAN